MQRLEKFVFALSTVWEMVLFASLAVGALAIVAILA